MICLAQYLYWEEKGELISCEECPFRETCIESKEE